MEITSWLCILIAMPFAVLVFITFQGLTFEQIIVEAIAYVILSSKRLISIPYNLYYDLTKEIIIKLRRRNLSMIKSYTKLLKLNKDKRSVPKSFQDTIPIATIYEDGIFKCGNKYTKTYRFSDINFSIASSEDTESMLLKYSDILNSFDSSVMAKITVNNRKVDLHHLENEVLFPLKNDYLDAVRKEYNSLVLSKEKESDEIRQDKYITITIFKNNILEARNYFKRITLELSQRFSSLGSKITELNANERL